MSATLREGKLFRGGSVEEVLAQVRDELGPDAIVVRQREGVVGGIGGFFARRCIEVEAVPGWPTSGDDAVLQLPAHQAASLYGAAGTEGHDARLAPPENPFVESLLDRAAAFDELFVPTEPVGLLPVEPPTRPSTEPDVRRAVAPPAPSEDDAHDFEAFVERAVAAAESALRPPGVSPSPEAVEMPAAPPAPAPAPPPARTAHDEFLDTEAGVRVSLAQAGMSSPGIELVVDRVRRHLHPLAPTSTVRELARLAVRTTLTTPLGWEGRRVIGFAGIAEAPTARAVAALASAHAAGGMRVAVVALGKGKQAARLAAHLVDTDVDVLLARTLQDVEPALAEAAAADLVLAVSPAVDPRDAEGAVASATPLLVLDPHEMHLVVPVGARADDVHRSVDLLDAYVPVDCVLPCGGGMADDLGAAVGVALERRLAIRWVASTGATLRTHPADPAVLADAVLP